MFTTSAPAPSQTGLPTSSLGPSAGSPSSALSPSSPTSRPSRLRGLSYLRNNFQNHLLSRDNNTNNSSSGNGNASSSSNNSSSLHANTQNFNSSSRLTRSISYTPASPTANQSQSQNPSTASHRFTLIPTLSHPLRSIGSPSASSSDNDTSAHPVSTIAISPSGLALGDSLGDNSTDEHTGRHSMTRTRSATTGSAMAATSDFSGNSNISGNSNVSGNSNLDILPSIRFSTFYDPRATRPSLTFSPLSRTLPTGGEIIRVGRYSERDSQPAVPTNVPSAAPVGFKSKVVSRRHCEFWYEGGKWYIKDVKSSSGTFLNHIRLSPPGTESKPFPINDGDIVQLGIDFKGGEEMIFRCVKMRIELNRGWQNKLNTFNMTTHKRLRNMTIRSGEKESSTPNSYSQDCSICLNSIAPCQSLFVAPCSHTWHFKCIRSLLSSPQYPIFICPNCRAAADLEAEVDDPEDWEHLDSDDAENEEAGKPDEEVPSKIKRTKESESSTPLAMANGRKSSDRVRKSIDRQRVSMERARASIERSRSKTDVPTASLVPRRNTDDMDVTIADVIAPSSHNPLDLVAADGGASTPSSSGSESRLDTSHATSDPRPIPAPIPRRTPSPHDGLPHLNGHDGPITPRNDVGPWVFDGSGMRIGSGAGESGAAVSTAHMESLDSFADIDTS